MAKKRSAVIHLLKRCILVGVFLFLIVSGSFFLFRNSLAEVGTNAVIQRVQSELEGTNITLQNIGYERVHVQASPLIVLEDVSIKLSASFPEIYARHVTAFAQADSVDVHWRFRNPNRLFLEIRSIRGDFESGILPESIPFDGLKEGLLRYELKVSDLRNPKQMSGRLKKAFYDLYTKNYTSENFRFKGDLSLRFEDIPFCVGFYTVPVKGGGTVLRLDAEDLLLISRNSVENECSQEEIDLMVKNPLKMPYIIYASLKCRRIANAYFAKDASFPKDAFRHILWSYQLTKKLGPEFAKKVTDAREQREDNNEAEHAMDYNNNDLGRKYALSGVSEEEIVNKVFTDPNVILKPQN